MKNLIIILSLFASFASADIDFENSQLEELKEIVDAPHRNIFIFISSNNCKYCVKQKELFLSDSEIYGKLQEYDSFHVNKDVESEGTISVAVTPAIIIFNENNEEIVRYYGFQDEVELTELLDSNIKLELEE